MLRVVLGLAVFAFTVYALVDCIQTDDAQVRNLPKVAWVLMILFFTPIGGIAWMIAGRPTSAIAPRPSGWDATPRRPRGPDDDPDFLRNL